MDCINELNKLWPLVYNRYEEHFGEKEINEFIDRAVEKWNELWPETFWAKRIDNKIDNGADNKKD